MDIQNVQYEVMLHETFNATRMLKNEQVEGLDFRVSYCFTSESLKDGEVIAREDVRHLTEVLHGVDLSALTNPAFATNEVIVRIIGQRALDYLFRMELNTTVQLR